MQLEFLEQLVIKKAVKMLSRSLDKGEINVRGREQPEVLELYQKALFNAGQLLACSKAEEAKESVAAEVPEVENGDQRNPLELLYPEMWAAVFDHLDNWRDLKSCYDTCQLFRDLLENSKNEWLFEGVLPLILWHLEESGIKPILKCRQICKAWKQQVDKSSKLDHLDFLDHYVSFQVGQNGRARIRRQIEDMVNHGKNPFVGQTVVIRVVSDLERFWELRLARLLEEPFNDSDSEEEQEAEDNGQDINPEQAAAILVQDINYFLNGLGQYITGIWFNVGPELTRTSVLCHLVLCILSKCQHLKMLHMHGLLNGERLEPLSEPEIDSVTPQDFTIAPSFQWLITDVRGFLPIQNRILQHCVGQLKKLETLEWASLTSNLEMGALEELSVEHDFELEEIDHLNIHQDLMQLRALKLTKLTFPVNASCTLLNLLQLTNQFPKIEHLTLQWNEDFVGFPIEQLLVIPEGLEPPHSLKTLQMSTYKQKYFDFLIFFPRLEYLKLSYWFIEDENEITTDQCAIVQVSEYWTEDRIYQSNVWELLPFLKAVMLSDDFDAFEDEDETLVYTRKEYTTINSKRSTC